MEVSSLIVPRVEVYWGPVNLTSPSKTPEHYAILGGMDLDALGPLVFDVRVGLEDQGQTPSGTFKWNPTGAGLKMYTYLLTKYVDHSIMVTFYYVTGGYIPFEFYWGGQSETYGKDMEMTVKLVTLMDGLMNANFYATAQADREEKGKSHKDSLSELEKMYGIKDYNLVQYTLTAERDTGKSTVKVSYNDGSNFMDAVQNLVKDNGNFVFFNNIGTAHALVYTPYTWEINSGDPDPTPAHRRIEGSTPLPPDPKIRYSYFLGPGMIQSFTRNYEWQPPQKSQELSSVLGRKPQGRQAQSRQSQRTRTSPDTQQASSQARATAPQGVYGSKGPSSNIRSENNGDGPKKQDLFTKERAAKLSATLFMCPALVGIKPMDIIFIGSYDGDFVEDWIISSVEYQQTQGGVEIAIQATRPFGLGENGVAKTMTKVPPSVKGATLKMWQEYAWQSSLPYSTRAIPPVTGAPTSDPVPSAPTPGSTAGGTAAAQGTAATPAPPSGPQASPPGAPSPPPAAPPGTTSTSITPDPASVQRVGENTFVITDPRLFQQLQSQLSKNSGYVFDPANRSIRAEDPSAVNVLQNILNIYAPQPAPLPGGTSPSSRPQQPALAIPPGSGGGAQSPSNPPTLNVVETIGPNTYRVNDIRFLQWVQQSPDFKPYVDLQTNTIRGVVPSNIDQLLKLWSKTR